MIVFDVRAAQEYYPLVFKNLREKFQTNAGAFISSICGDVSLRELPTPGKSGAAFFVSSDDRYFIKTMTKGGRPGRGLPPRERAGQAHPVGAMCGSTK